MLRKVADFLKQLVGIRVKEKLLWSMALSPHLSGEYSMAVVQANELLEDQCQVRTSESSTLVGIYDGHGGPEASIFVRRTLFPNFQQFVHERGEISIDVIRRAFAKTEDDFWREVSESPRGAHMEAVGSCCIFGVFTEDAMFIANLGDSRAVLGYTVANFRSKHSVVADRLTNDHNASSVEVRRELQLLHPNDPQIVTFTRGTWRVKGIIQISRSFGDFYLKRNGLQSYPHKDKPLTAPALSAEPEIARRDINQQDLFVIFASDGLWEHLTDAQAVEIVAKNKREATHSYTP